ncbi:transposable element Tcb1 transposase [Trichonephila clavipes]|nr:transposable element Tcb1 transposase [Trichonephila clavipes]
MLVVFVTFATLVSCSSDNDGLCRAFKENGILRNETSDSTLQLTFEHSFVNPDRGIVPGLQYNGNHQTARRVRHNDESVREGYIRNGGKEVQLFTSALKAFQCNKRIVKAQRKHLDDFLRGTIIGRLECERTQLEVSEELGIAHSVISKLWQRFQDDGNVSRCYGTATGTTVSRQTVYRRLGHISLYARRPVRCVPPTATHCHLRLTCSREHAMWTPQQWSCVMFSDESRFNLQSECHRTLKIRAPGTRYHQEKTIERHRYGGCRLGRNYSSFQI